jgi:hypothetical protein
VTGPSRKLVGKEKLSTDAGLSRPLILVTRVTRFPLFRNGCKLDPLPVAVFGGGDASRAVVGGCVLADRLCPCAELTLKDSGMLGTGGASSALCRGLPSALGAGLGVRNVRCVIELELSLRSSMEEGRPFRFVVEPSWELAQEEFDADRRMVRLVCTSATFVGVIGLALRAAAAAAADSVASPFLFCWARKASAAAEVAFGFASAPLPLTCCISQSIELNGELESWCKARCPKRS